MLSPQRMRLALARVLVALPLLLVANPGAAGAASPTTTLATTRPGFLPGTSATATTVTLAGNSCKPAVAFDPGSFSPAPKISNKWLPLVPGTQFILDGFVNGVSSPVPHRVVLTVTDLTKVVDGVRNVVLWDRDFSNGQLIESELTFFAQDYAGNVWNLGEYPEEYESGVFVGAPSTWIAGQKGAQGGLQMLADPQVSTPGYLQGVAPNIQFKDCGQVYAKGLTVVVPFGTYKNVLEIDEWSPLDPASGHQHKFFAPGVGNVQVTAVGDPEAETLQLVKIVHLNPPALAQVRAEVLKMDERAYEVSAVYGATQPAQ